MFINIISITQTYSIARESYHYLILCGSVFDCAWYTQLSKNVLAYSEYKLQVSKNKLQAKEELVNCHKS